MQIYDRIDLKASGTWVNNFRPNGLVLSFSNNIKGGESFSSVTNVLLPYGTTIREIKTHRQDIAGYVASVNLPKSVQTGQTIPGATVTGNTIYLPDTIIFTRIFFPAGTKLLTPLVSRNAEPTINPQTFDTDTTVQGTYKFRESGASMDTWGYIGFGAVIEGHILAKSYPGGDTGQTNYLQGISNELNGARVSADVDAIDVFIPFGVTFKAAVTINSKQFPIGLFSCDPADAFLMNTIQLLDATNTVVFSVHDIASEEVIAFVRPKANINRLIMYKDGIGVDATTFACYGIVFRTNITAAMLAAFNAIHPSDINPVVVDDGSVKDPNIIFPQ